MKNCRYFILFFPSAAVHDLMILVLMYLSLLSAAPGASTIVAIVIRPECHP